MRGWRWPQLGLETRVHSGSPCPLPSPRPPVLLHLLRLLGPLFSRSLGPSAPGAPELASSHGEPKTSWGRSLALALLVMGPASPDRCHQRTVTYE